MVAPATATAVAPAAATTAVDGGGVMTDRRKFGRSVGLVIYGVFE